MAKRPLLHEQLTRSIIGAFFDVHNRLGFGFLEKLYLTALERELKGRGHVVDRELSVRVMYGDIQLGMQRLDMIVDGLVVVEAKSTAIVAEVARRQLLNYLRATSFEVGLLLHFGPKAQFTRLIYENRFKPRGS